MEDLEKQSRELFRPAREESVSAPLYMKTRVLAQLNAQKRQSQSLMLWRVLSLSLVLILSLSTTWFLRQQQGAASPFIAAVGKPMAVKIELAALQANEVEIELPEGVTFYSEKIAALAQQKTLDLQLGANYSGADLPIVIKSKEKGLKQIKVRFYHQDRGLILEKTLQIEFQGEGVT